MAPAKTLYVREDDMPLWEQAEAAAKTTRQSVSTLVAAALRNYLSTVRGIHVVIEPDDPGAVTFDEKGTPILTYGRHQVHGQGWTLLYLEPGGKGIDEHFIPGGVDDLDTALESARAWLRLSNGGIEDTITIEVGEPSFTIGFTGRWLIEPDRNETRTGQEGYDVGAYWGVALTKRGRIAVYTAHCNGRWPAHLDDYEDLDDAAHDVPADILAMAAAKLGQERIVWRDI
jgi:hypothetical protein